MQLIEMTVEVPAGYLLCPYPKSWMREHERIALRIEEVSASAITIDLVLSHLRSHRALIDWTTMYSGVKGSKEFLVGLQDDIFYVEPNHNKVEYEVVSVRAENVRLYAKAYLKQSSSR